MDIEGFSIREAIAIGWRKTLANLWPFFLVIIASWIASGIVNALNRVAAKHHSPVFSILVSVLGWIVLFLIHMGFLRVALKALDDGKMTIQDFATSLPEFLKFFGASFLWGVLVAAGLFLFIIPGVILGLRLQFYSYLILEKKLAPLEAIKASWTITSGQTLRLCLFALTLIGIVILGALLIGVGLLVALPLAAVSAAFVYRKLAVMSPTAVA